MRTPKLLRGFNYTFGGDGGGTWIGFNRDGLQFLRLDTGLWFCYYKQHCLAMDKRLSRCIAKSQKKASDYAKYYTAALAELEKLEVK